MLVIKAMVTHLTFTMVYVLTGGIFHSGKYLDSQILKVFFNVGPRMCMLRCTKFAGCTAFNFEKSHLYCELLNATQQATAIDKEHYMYSEMSTWTIESDTCWPNPCSFGETCVITNKDLPVCVNRLNVSKQITREYHIAFSISHLYLPETPNYQRSSALGIKVVEG